VDDPRVGDVVDTRYELRRLVARGGMGLVFEAHHRFTRRAVALKILPAEVRERPEYRDRLVREAHALTAVRCPGFVEILDGGVCGQHGPYLVLEMLEGRTLDGILASRHVLDVPDAVQLGRQVCDAVAHGHGRGVVHRDLKPSNIFLARAETGEELVKIIDLGVAAVAEEKLAETDRKLTALHSVIGTPEYMAPEQLFGKPVDGRTDVYAIGMTLYECLTGTLPYTGTYPEVIVQVSRSEGPPSVREKRPDVSLALATVIENALEKDVEARFQSAAELGRALSAAGGIAKAPTALLARGVAKTHGDDDESERAISLVRKKPRRDVEGAPVSEPAESRRHVARMPYMTPVVATSSTGETIEARSEEISEAGILLLAPASLAIGEALRIALAAPVTGEMVEVEGVVRWTRDGRGCCVLGVELAEVPDALRAAIAQSIATTAAASG
jgi:serine/threonine-protein kinase